MIKHSFCNRLKYVQNDNCERSNFVSVKLTSEWNCSPSSFVQTIDRCHSTVARKLLKSRRSVIKMLSVVVLIYFISFSPQVLVFILFDTNAIRPVPKFIQTSYFVALTMLLVTISSASNPIVYAIFSSKFRQSFARLFQKMRFYR